MGFGGHALDMLLRTRQNRALKEAKRERYKKVLDAQYSSDVYGDIPFIDKHKLTEEEFVIYKERIRKKFARQRKRQQLVFGIILTLCITGATFLFFRFFF